MKRTLVYGAATAVVALSLGSCGLVMCRNQQTTESLYGPPPDMTETDDDLVEEDYSPTLEQPDDVDGPIETVYGPPPEDEPIEDVYGPPVPMDDYDDELIEGVYGPPVSMGVFDG